MWECDWTLGLGPERAKDPNLHVRREHPKHADASVGLTSRFFFPMHYVVAAFRTHLAETYDANDCVLNADSGLRSGCNH